MYIMNINRQYPIVVYDNQCYLCVKFAKVVDFLSRGRLSFVGHYTKEGEKIRNQILDESALSMFWLIKEKTAYGGRAALIPLCMAIISAKNKKSKTLNKEECEVNCKNAKSVFVRSASLLTNSKKINY